MSEPKMKVVYFALKPMRKGADEYYEIGEMLPQARDWTMVDVLMRSGEVGVVPVACLPSGNRAALAEWEDEQDALAEKARKERERDEAKAEKARQDDAGVNAEQPDRPGGDIGPTQTGEERHYVGPLASDADAKKAEEAIGTTPEASEATRPVEASTTPSEVGPTQTGEEGKYVGPNAPEAVKEAAENAIGDPDGMEKIREAEVKASTKKGDPDHKPSAADYEGVAYSELVADVKSREIEYEGRLTSEDAVKLLVKDDRKKAKAAGGTASK